MSQDRPSLLWLLAILAVPALYLALALPLELGIGLALRHSAPGLAAWSGQFAKSAIALLALWPISRHRLQGIAGLSRHEDWDCRLLALVPLYLPVLILGTMVHGNGLQVLADPGPVLAASAHALLTGFSEEVFFRGLVLSVFVKLFWTKRGGVAFAVLLSSAIFGMMHLVNGVTWNLGPGFHVETVATLHSLVSALVQVVYAAFFGVFFSALLLRMNKLWPLVLIHALVNLPMDLQRTRGILPPGASETDGIINLGGIIWTIPLLLFGLLLIRAVKPADIARKLGAPFGGAAGSANGHHPTG